MWVNVLRESQKVVILNQSDATDSVVIPGTQSKTLLAESDDHTIYFENNFSVYISKFLICKQFSCSGELYKKSRAKLASKTRQLLFSKKTVKVDFEKCVFSYDGVIAAKYQQYSFTDLVSVKRTDIIEETYDTDCKWKYKFTVYLKKKHIDFFSRTVEERSLWIQTFCRVLDALAGVKPEISGVSSTAYKNLLEEDRKSRSKSAAAINRNPQSHVVDGIESYSSASMQYNTFLVKGNIMKQIENVKWYHTSNFHQKHFTINFTGSTL